MENEMSSMKDLIKDIEVSLGMPPPGPSRISKQETRTCPDCCEPFTTTVEYENGKQIYMQVQGESVLCCHPRFCLACVLKRRTEREKKEAEAGLPEITKQRRALWEERCNLPAKFCVKTFQDFEAKLQPKAFDAIKNLPPESSLLLLSPGIYGLGKTHLLAAYVNRLVAEEEAAWMDQSGHIRTLSCPVYYTTETQLLTRIRATFNKRDDEDEKAETESQVYSYLENVTYLIIDDVGKVRPHDTSFLQSVYFNIIDGRYSSESPVIMASNLSPSEFEAHVGGACADRLREMCGKNIVLMKGQSYRLRGVKAD